MPTPATKRYQYDLGGLIYVSNKYIHPKDLEYLARAGSPVRKSWGLVSAGGKVIVKEGNGTDSIRCQHERVELQTKWGTNCSRCRRMLPAGTNAITCIDNIGDGSSGACRSWFCQKCETRPPPRVNLKLQLPSPPKRVNTSPSPARTSHPTIHPLSTPIVPQQQSPSPECTISELLQQPTLHDKIQLEECYHGERSLEVATSTGLLGWKQITEQNNIQDGITHLRTAKDILSEHHRNSTSESIKGNLGTCRSQLGWGLLCDGSAEDAQKELEHALTLLINVDGVKSHSAAVCRSRLAWCFVSLGRLSDAQVLCHESLDTFQFLWGDAHPDTATCRSQYGWILFQLGYVNEAGAELKRSLDALLVSVGDNNLSTITCRYRLGWVLHISKMNSSLAKEFLEESARGFSSHYGKDHPITVAAVGNLKSVDDDVQQQSSFQSPISNSNVPPSEPLQSLDQNDITPFLNANNLSDCSALLRQRGITTLQQLSNVTAKSLPPEIPWRNQKELLKLSKDGSIDSWIRNSEAT